MRCRIVAQLAATVVALAGCSPTPAAPDRTVSRSAQTAASDSLPAPAPTSPPTIVPTATTAPFPRQVATNESELQQARFSRSGWKTDFSKHSVPLSEISSGGPPRDGIPPIDRPRFESVGQVAWLEPQEPVIHFQIGDDARAYPLQVLIWHEIVNDEVGGVPAVVTFCPLCNTAIAFDRRLDGRVLDFGTTGNLRRSDLVMWDRQTESWWQQITGEAIIGELTGARLQMLPATIVSWAQFRDSFPRGQVLSRETGFARDYGRNPYVGYDRVDQTPFLYDGPTDGRLPPMERVVTVSLNGEDAAYPFSALREHRVVADRVGGRPVAVFYQPGTTSALDASAIAASRDVGAAAVYSPRVGDRELTFTWRDEAFVDAETGSRWSLIGRSTAGPLAGSQLSPIVSGNHFWFAIAVFRPNVRVWKTG